MSEKLLDRDGARTIDAVMRAAMPPVLAGIAPTAARAGVMRIAPEATVRVTKVVVPLPSARLTLSRPIWISPVVAFFWNENDPVRRWPATSRVMPSPLTFRPGVSTTASTVLFVSVVLSCSSKVPENSTPGTSTATDADIRPAMPPGVPAVAPMIWKTPDPLLTTTMSRWGVPRRSPAFAKRTVRSYTRDAGSEPSALSRARRSTDTSA